MPYHPLGADHAVAPQIAPEDLPGFKAAGFTTIICNRPDTENPVELQADVLRAAATAAGLAFAENPVVGGGFTMDHIARQAELMDQSEGKTLAYCASGTRSAILWAMTQAGTLPTEQIMTTLASAGYNLDGLRAQIDMLAAQK
ncbi:TIGR01244 family sulfur transferase [Tropicimonas sp. S265A]|uniref:TIGR01244 family sulfur transferase n=1 Tax=Tropicimonas sp. S265A TaxID=3415134 RepID=UPI003C7AC337